MWRPVSDGGGCAGFLSFLRPNVEMTGFRRGAPSGIGPGNTVAICVPYAHPAQRRTADGAALGLAASAVAVEDRCECYTYVIADKPHSVGRDDLERAISAWFESRRYPTWQP